MRTMIISNSFAQESNCCEVCRREITGNVSNTCPDLIDVKGSVSSSSSSTSSTSSNGGAVNTQSLSQKLKQNHKKVCTACKKFYRRIKLLETELFTKECTCVSFLTQQGSPLDHQDSSHQGQFVNVVGANNLVAPNSVSVGSPPPSQQQSPQSIICRACRARKCHSLLSADSAALSLQSSDHQPSTNDCSPVSSCHVDSQKHQTPRPQISVRLIPCEICETSSSGYHFGAMTCEGCKGFFRRAVGRNYVCCFVGDIANSVTYHERIDKCKHCRLEACLRVGMSLASVKRGRRSLLRRLDTSLYVKRLHESNQLLPTPVSRRKTSMQQHQHLHPQTQHLLHHQQINQEGNDFKSDRVYLQTNQPLLVSIAERSTSMPPALMHDAISVSHSTPSTECDTLAQAGHDSVPAWPDLKTNSSSTNATSNNLPTSYLFEQSDFLQQVADSAKYLLEIRSHPGVILTFDMSPLAMWQAIISAGFERNVNAISAFVRHLPGFRQLVHSDKEKLFVNSYFPILFAELSREFIADQSVDGSSGQVGFVSAFALKDTQSAQVFQQSFHYINGLVQQKLYEAGTYTVAWRPSSCEFAIFCGLLFFNPNLPGLSNPEVIAQVFSVYHQAYLELNRLRLPASSCLVDDEGVKLNGLLDFFNGTITPVFINAMHWLANYLPESVNCHLFWAEMNRSLGIV